MSDVQNSLPAGDAEHGTLKAEPSHLSGLTAMANGKHLSEFRMEDGAYRGHTLLSGPPAPQGRRSLFRR
jgi:hypothetical protein